MTKLNPKIQFTEHFTPLFIPTDPHYKTRFITYYGGRAGMKTWQVGRGILCRTQRQRMRVLCTREHQARIRDSVFELLRGQAYMLGISGFFDFRQTSILAANGSEIIFEGLSDFRRKKGVEDIDLVWNEEGENTTEESWVAMEATIRKAGSQIITNFNTGQEEDFIYQELVVGAGQDHLTQLVTYLDNPWASEETIRSAERMKKKDPDAYAHIWLGQPWTRSDAQILNGCWRIDEMDIPKDEDGNITADGPYFGADFGFSSDAATLIKFWIIGRTKENPGILYIEHEAYEHGVEVNDYPEFYDRIEGSRDHTIRADNSRPEIISHIKKKDFKIVSAKKWDGSVKDGITFLRAFDEIVIHPRCKYTAQEARLWKYKTDRLTGDVLPVVIDANNHCFDAIRYGLQPLIKPQKEIMMRTT